MSEILDLARNFEERSKQQATATEQRVANAYAQHEQNLLSALLLSEETLSAAINARETSLNALLSATEANTRALVVSSWKWLLGTILTVLLASTGALLVTGKVVAENLRLIEQQKVTMANMQGLGVEFIRDKNGQFIVLPMGMKPVMGWTFNNGSRQAIKLE